MSGDLGDEARHSSGQWIGIRPTGKPVVVTAVNADRVVDGRIVEHGGAANFLGPLLATGAVQVAGNFTTGRRTAR